MATFMGEVNTSTEGMLWSEELPSSFLQVMTTWAQNLKDSIQAAVQTKCPPQSPQFQALLQQCLETIKNWDEDTKTHTVLQTLQLGNPRAALLYEHCFLRYIREVNTVGAVTSLKPPPLAEFAHRFLVKTLHIPNPVLAIRATMFDFIDFALRDQPTHVPLLDGLAQEF
jgi:hypothetical protein